MRKQTRNNMKEETERQIRFNHAREIVNSGKCPDCGSPLYRNNAMTGWWQCEGYPCQQMRHSGFENLPKCEFQIFIE